MAKRARAVRRTRRTQQRQTNWLVIGGVIAAAVVFFGLMALALREPEGDPGVSLASYCEENPENCVVMGNNDAPVTIVEVSDYACSHCADFNLNTASLLEDLYVTPGEVKWVVMPFALYSTSTPAVEAAFCAKEQGRFFEFHHAMFEIQQLPIAMTPDGFVESATRAGLDLDVFGSCLENGDYGSRVQSNNREAMLAGVSATPTFFINDTKLEGARPLTTFQQQINAILGS